MMLWKFLCVGPGADVEAFLCDTSLGVKSLERVPQGPHQRKEGNLIVGSLENCTRPEVVITEICPNLD